MKRCWEIERYYISFGSYHLESTESPIKPSSATTKRLKAKEEEEGEQSTTFDQRPGTELGQVRYSSAHQPSGRNLEQPPSAADWERHDPTHVGLISTLPA